MPEQTELDRLAAAVAQTEREARAAEAHRVEAEKEAHDAQQQHARAVDNARAAKVALITHAEHLAPVPVTRHAGWPVPARATPAPVDDGVNDV